MLPAALTYHGRFPRTLIDLHWSVVSASLTVSSRISYFLFQVISAIRKRIHAIRSSTCLDIIEGIIGAKGFVYFSEAVVTSEFAFLLVALCVSRRGVPHQDLERLRNNRFFLETIEAKIPHVHRWYQALNGITLTDRLMDCREAVRSSPSILDRTPAEATRRHSEEIARGLWRHPPAAGRVRLHFFRTHLSQRHEGDFFQRPDVRIDLAFDSKHGINLGQARKLLGVEKLSVITSLSPHRTTFDPIDRDKLSPVAVYDLSKQFRGPIRVFEPSPSIITRVKRKIHDIIFLSIYLVFTLFRSCLGFTLNDSGYLAVTFSNNFAARCVQLSKFIRPLNLLAREGVWLITQLCAFLFLLPLLMFKAAVFVHSSMFSTALGALALFFTFLMTARDTLSSLFRLPLKAWIMVVAFSWITLADLLSTSLNS